MRRGAYLERLRDQIMEELSQRPLETPKSLALRYMDWYPRSVAPVLVALSSHSPHREIVNLPSHDGIVREQAAWVSSERISAASSMNPPSCVVPWLDVYERHERAFCTALSEPSLAAVRTTLELDPTVAKGRVASLSSAVWNVYQNEKNVV